MIKVKAGIATREITPVFLSGLDTASLSDLSWTDPALGVSDCAWWPEHDQSPPLGENEKYDGETLTADAETKTVIVVKGIRPMTEDEIVSARKALVPAEITRWQALTILNQAGLLDVVESYVSGLDNKQAQIDFSAASVWRREWAWLGDAATAIGLTDEQVDKMFIDADKL